jgi:hypothetical protein
MNDHLPLTNPGGRPPRPSDPTVQGTSGIVYIDNDDCPGPEDPRWTNSTGGDETTTDRAIIGFPLRSHAFELGFTGTLQSHLATALFARGAQHYAYGDVEKRGETWWLVEAEVRPALTEETFKEALREARERYDAQRAR